MPFYRAKFTIETEQEDELGLLKDQLAFAKDENAHQEGDWIQCVCIQTGRVGLLPLNYIKEIEPPSKTIYTLMEFDHNQMDHANRHMHQHLIHALQILIVHIRHILLNFYMTFYIVYFVIYI